MISVNANARPLLDALIERAEELRVSVERDSGGATLIDAGAKHAGGIVTSNLLHFRDSTATAAIRARSST